MRIPGSKAPVIDQPIVREKAGAESASRTAQSGGSSRVGETAVSSGLDRTVLDAEAAGREIEQSIATRLEEVREQLRGGSYSVDYDRLARRLAEEGLDL